MNRREFFKGLTLEAVLSDWGNLGYTKNSVPLAQLHDIVREIPALSRAITHQEMDRLLWFLHEQVYDNYPALTCDVFFGFVEPTTGSRSDWRRENIAKVAHSGRFANSPSEPENDIPYAIGYVYATTFNKCEAECPCPRGFFTPEVGAARNAWMEAHGQIARV